MNDASHFVAELPAFEEHPLHASRISGLGGYHPPPDVTYAFRTAHLIAPGGLITVRVAFRMLRATRGALVVEVISDDGPSRRQVALRTLSLASLAQTGGVHEISLPSDRPGSYVIAGNVYDETDAAADGLDVTISVRPAPARSSSSVQLPSMARVSRLTSIEPPTFQRPSSQAMSPAQLREGAFDAACNRLGLSPNVAAWAPAYIVQALEFHLNETLGLRGFGAGINVECIARLLTAQGASIVATSSPDPASWPPANNLDFAWAISEEAVQPPLAVFVKVCSLLERVRPSGYAVLVFPLEHGRMPHEHSLVSKRGDIEILALTMLGHAHDVAQLKFRTGGRPPLPGTRSPFGLIVRRAAS